VTRVRVVFEAYGYQPNGSMYLDQGEVTNRSYEFRSEGNGTYEVLDVSAADGLTSGEWILLSEGDGRSSDYRIDVTIETSDTCGDSCVPG